jgi:hypothetical protein
MPSLKTIAVLVLLASLAGLSVSIFAMAKRVAMHYESSDQKLYMFSRVNVREFKFADRPVTLRDDESRSATVLVVDYGDEQLRLAATIEPGPEQLPELIRHNDWMHVLRFAEHGRASVREADQRIKRGEVPDRLVIVVRNPPRGTDAHAWGQVWRKMWTFDFYEFLPEGGFAHQRLGYPTHRRTEPPKPGELAEGTWQFHAALLAMPSGSKPTPKFTGDAIRAMDWTLPLAAFSVLAFLASAGALVTPARRARWH